MQIGFRLPSRRYAEGRHSAHFDTGTGRTALHHVRTFSRGWQPLRPRKRPAGWAAGLVGPM